MIPKVSIIIPHWNGIETLSECLDSIICSDFKSYDHYLSLRKNFLDYALLNNRLSIIEANSFQKLEIANSLQENRSYNFFKLPIEINLLAEEIVKIYNKRNLLWPGGKKGKFPSLES